MAHAQRPPSVDAVARSLRHTGLPHPLLVDIARSAIATGELDNVEAIAHAKARTLLQPVVNATGVLLHTNLGRAPLAHHQDATYTNLEFRLADGSRGSRSDHVATLIARLVEAEAALVVNNCAAAVLLALAALAGGGRGVAVSRGELVEIGGGFRVPDVMAQSGARLVEVGTTNRTRRADFERAVHGPGADIAVVLKVHQSNYRIVGFTETVEVPDLVGLGPAVVADIGSGLVDAACPWLAGGPPAWLAGEPAAKQTLRAGADLVLFSGDKLFGGPQAGIIAGRADLVALCARHPLARALRPGGLVLAALAQTTMAYLRRDGDAIALWRMASVPVERLAARAAAIAHEVAQAVGAVSGMDGRAANTDRTGLAVKTERVSALTVVELSAVPGGGTLPGAEIPSAGLALAGDRVAALRGASPPVIARVQEGRTVLDLRTVAESEDGAVSRAVLAALTGPGGATAPGAVAPTEAGGPGRRDRSEDR